MVSDTQKDEQIYEVYSNHLPTIISNTPRMALVGELFKYQVRVEDLNEGANLKYNLIKGPHGMQLDKSGKILWVRKLHKSIIMILKFLSQMDMEPISNLEEYL